MGKPLSTKYWAIVRNRKRVTEWATKRETLALMRPGDKLVTAVFDPNTKEFQRALSLLKKA